MDWFNFELNKKYIVMFGCLFDNMYINKMQSESIRTNTNDTETTNIIKGIKVPINYANKDKLIMRYRRRGNDPDDIQDLVKTTLPRMAYEFTTITYDQTRKLNKNHIFISPIETDTGTIKTQFSPVPYNITVELSIMANRTEDGAKIVEQILPNFTPSIIVSSNLIPENNIILDIPIILNNVYVNEEYEGNFTKERVITWGLNFTMKAYYFNNINTNKVIKNIEVNAEDGNLLTMQPDPSYAFYNEDYGFTTN